MKMEDVIEKEKEKGKRRERTACGKMRRNGSKRYGVRERWEYEKKKTICAANGVVTELAVVDGCCEHPQELRKHYR